MTVPGGTELLIILAIFVLLFGAKKLPELSRSVGQSITSFKQGVRDSGEDEADAADTGDGQGSGEPEAGADARAPGDQGQTAQDRSDTDRERDKEPRHHGDA